MIYEAEKTLTALQACREALIVSHISPDGDTIGSLLALGRVLEQRGVHVTLYNEDGTLPKSLQFLGVEDITSILPPVLPETVIYVDCADKNRGGKTLAALDLSGSLVINIDHHDSNVAFGTINLVDAGAAATGLIIYRLMRTAGWEIDRESATCLYTAFVTDTGRFSYTNTSAEILHAAADLCALVDVSFINNTIYEQKTPSQAGLMGRALSSLAFYAGGKVAVIALYAKDFDETGGVDSESEGFVAYVRGIEGVEVAILAKEAAPGIVRFSLRSLNYADVSRVAARFGGGGHIRAAGCVQKRSLPEALTLVLAAVEEELRLCTG
jgi:phosphoesterase RecJ-like protein